MTESDLVEVKRAAQAVVDEGYPTMRVSAKAVINIVARIQSLEQILRENINEHNDLADAYEDEQADERGSFHRNWAKDLRDRSGL